MPRALGYSLLGGSIRCSDDGKSLFGDDLGNRRKRFKLLPNQTSARPEVDQDGPILSKFPVVFPVRREFGAADLEATK
jgi:hypothetical protein